MRVSFEHVAHPRIAQRKSKKVGPPTTAAEHLGLNGRIALVLTTAVWPLMVAAESSLCEPVPVFDPRRPW